MLRLEAERACLIALGAPETFLAVAGEQRRRSSTAPA